MSVFQPRTSRTKQLHVVHLIEALGPGGAERLLYTNLKHFNSEQVKSTVITVFPHATHWREAIEALGIPVVCLDCGGPRDIPKGIRKLRAWLRENPTDVIHTHLWTANIIGRVAGRFSRTPVISSIHNPDHEADAWADGADVKLMKRRIVREFDRWTAHAACDRMIAVSEYVKQSANRHLSVSLDAIEVVYNPIDVDLVKTAPAANREELLRAHGLPAHSLILLSVARVSPQKGLIYALRALPEILKQYPAVHLLSVGATTDPAWHKQLEQEAAALGVADHFHLLGARRDVIDFLRACDVFIFPSLYEGLGIALIEAMAAGCACVASATGPIPEVVTDGEDGVLVAPGDPQAIATAVCRLLADESLRVRLGTAASQSVLTRFRPEQSVATLTRIYQELLERKQGKHVN